MFNWVSKPLLDKESEERKRLEENSFLVVEKIKALEENLKQVRKETKETSYELSPELFKTAADIGSQIKELENSLEKRGYVVQDITPEAIVQIMQRNGGRIAALSDEGEFLQIVGGRYSDGKAQIESCLKAYYGAPLKVSRVNRDDIALRAAYATIGLMIQPKVWNDCIEHPQFRSKGFLGRFLYAEPESNVGWRKYDLEEFPEDLSEHWRAKVLSLLDPEEEVELKFDQDALDHFVEWCQFIEHSQRPGGTLYTISDWASKLAGTLARIAALFALVKNCSQIDMVTIRQAIVFADCFLIPEAVKVLGEESEYRLDKTSIDLLTKIQEGCTCHRDVRSKRAFRTFEKFEAVVRPLIDEGLVSHVIEEIKGRTRDRFTLTELGEAVLEGERIRSRPGRIHFGEDQPVQLDSRFYAAFVRFYTRERIQNGSTGETEEKAQKRDNHAVRADGRPENGSIWADPYTRTEPNGPPDNDTHLRSMYVCINSYLTYSRKSGPNGSVLNGSHNQAIPLGTNGGSVLAQNGSVLDWPPADDELNPGDLPL